ncbi:MAG: hypothetical protein IKA47_11465 [Oscillospiraceae bacterium]|nr:hypothetical protein [Oscillospiraceae bacterium]MBR2422019.1 hypothetical protein [Oscillospiraceae bacterium]
MDKPDIITLAATKYKKDALNQHVPDGETTRDIFCNIKSITRAEWAAAANRGLKAACCVTVWADEYQGESIAILGGVRYAVYRTYQPNSEDMELYLERKAGV